MKTNQHRHDAIKLLDISERLLVLEAAYQNTLADLRNAQRALKVIATWARHESGSGDLSDIHDRAMDALALISEANR